MYTVTFYSFKGGVGRSMALVNVAAELAQSGSRVLVVDFDLEAPGLDTFKLAKPNPVACGIVDYVTRYRETRVAPDVSGYVYKASVTDGENGKLWIMPAGKQDSLYASRLNSIAWQRLYEDLDGYLLFEDLKAQWEKILKLDYVLIDSRTGHTDVGGICTRQLPDAVVIFFFPNEQNRSGLEKVVRQIRHEADPPRSKRIQLHFVMSNVPDLDDEEEILAGSVRRLKESLEYEELAATVHHYPSLALLDQTVFCLVRPKSRLAQEYRQIVTAIRQNNIEDREGALAFLGELRSRRLVSKDLDQSLAEIRTKHAGDGEVLRRMANFRKRQGRLDDAIELLNAASGAGLEDTDLLLSRAEMNDSLDRPAAAITDLKKLLNLGEVPIWELIRAVKLLAKLEPDSVDDITASRAFSTLGPEGRLLIANEFLSSHKTLEIAEAIARSMGSQTPPNEEYVGYARNSIILSLISQRRFSEAKHTVSPVLPQPEGMEIHDAFNFAMADWGESGTPPKVFFQRVVDLSPERGSPGPNFLQCVSLAHWAVGNVTQALEQLAKARELMTKEPREELSVWRYLRVSPAQFLQDLDSQERMIKGEELTPAVFRDGN